MRRQRRVRRTRERGGHQTGSGADGGVGAEARRTRHADTSADAEKVSEIVLVSRSRTHGHQRGGVGVGKDENPRCYALEGLRKKVNVQDLDLAAVLLCRVQDVRRFQARYGKGHVRADGLPVHRSGVGVHTARNVDGEDHAGAPVDEVKDLRLLLGRRPVETDAEHAVHQDRRRGNGLLRKRQIRTEIHNGDPGLLGAFIVLYGIRGRRFPERQDAGDVVVVFPELPGNDEAVSAVFALAAEHGHRALVRRKLFHQDPGAGGPRFLHQPQKFGADFIFPDFHRPDFVCC